MERKGRRIKKIGWGLEPVFMHGYGLFRFAFVVIEFSW